jgi:hypothetical protein
MKKVIIKTINVRSYMQDVKTQTAEKKINEFIYENNLDVISVSLFKENEDEYIFTLTLQ